MPESCFETTNMKFERNNFLFIEQREFTHFFLLTQHIFTEVVYVHCEFIGTVLIFEIYMVLCSNFCTHVKTGQLRDYITIFLRFLLNCLCMHTWLSCVASFECYEWPPMLLTQTRLEMYCFSWIWGTLMDEQAAGCTILSEPHEAIYELLATIF